MSDTTFDRSMEHWSERNRAGMEAFYRLATYDYRLLAEACDWPARFAGVAARTGSPVKLLDVACGSGKFPRALLDHGGMADAATPVEYDLLDPAAFSVREAKSRLAGPFRPAGEHVCMIQDLRCGDGAYGVVWATHALYCVPAAELPAAAGRMARALHPEGVGFIAHAAAEAHYVKFHDLFLRSAGAGKGAPYSTGEQVIEAFGGVLGRPPASRLVEYEGTIPLDDTAVVEGYLQRCLFDDSLALGGMMADEVLGPYLSACRDEEAGLWRFPQKVWLIEFGTPGG